MIRHIVLARFRPDLAAGDIETVLAGLHRLATILPGILAITSGPNASPEGIARGYTHAFVVDFADAAARDFYLADADHAAAGAALVAAADGGVDGLLVIDYALPAA